MNVGEVRGGRLLGLIVLLTKEHFYQIRTILEAMIFRNPVQPPNALSPKLTRPSGKWIRSNLTQWEKARYPIRVRVVVVGV